VKRGWPGWEVGNASLQIFGASSAKSADATIAAQLLGEPATGEPYTILIMGSLFFSHCAVYSTHHAEGIVNPKVREPANGYYFWIPQSM
jgi:hypothetical protein